MADKRRFFAPCGGVGGRVRLTALSALALSACASSVGEDRESRVDPFEPVNRVVFTFNEVLDGVLIKPVTLAYRSAVPEYGRERVSNVLKNLSMPVVLVNSVLQGDPGNAFSAFWSFTLNTTLGVGGIFDFAGANTNLKVRKEDFGQTMGVWGWGSGAYLVLPIFGPSSGRDAFGLTVDTVGDPFNYADDAAVIARTVMRAIDARTDNLQVIDDIYDTSLDPYATIRSAYLQRRDSQVANDARKEKQAEEQR